MNRQKVLVISVLVPAVAVAVFLSVTLMRLIVSDVALGSSIDFSQLGLPSITEYISLFPWLAVMLFSLSILVTILLMRKLVIVLSNNSFLVASYSLSKLLIVWFLIFAGLTGLTQIISLDNSVMDSAAFRNLRTFASFGDSKLIVGTVLQIEQDNNAIKVVDQFGIETNVTFPETEDSISIDQEPDTTNVIVVDETYIQIGDEVALYVNILDSANLAWADIDRRASISETQTIENVRITNPVAVNPTFSSNVEASVGALVTQGQPSQQASNSSPDVTPTETSNPSAVTADPPTPIPVQTTTPTDDSRPVIKAFDNTRINQANTIYDFEGRNAADVSIEASNVEVRNLRGPGARRIGARNGKTISDSGFRDFDLTFANILMSDGADIIRPYFINGTDVNTQPNIGDGDIMQFFAYQGGDIVEPLVEGVVLYGKQRPSGSIAHNDTIQYTAISGGRVLDPIIRNSTLLGASSAAVQIKHVHGTITIENSTLSERFESFHAVIASEPRTNSTIRWINNTLLNGSSASFTNGWLRHPDSTGNLDGVTIR